MSHATVHRDVHCRIHALVIPLIRMLGLVFAVLMSAQTHAGIVAEEHLLLPLAPATLREHVQLSPGVPLDPSQPVWVGYQLVAVSASDKPEGKIVLEASLEGVPVDIKDLRVTFLADKLQQSKSAGTVGAQLEAQIGKRTPEELMDMFGPELYAAYVALNEKRGTVLEGAKVKTYGPTGSPEATLLVSIEAAEGMQPMLIKITMGQGEMPAELEAAKDTGLPFSPLALVAVVFVVLAWFRFRK